ncbi:hypothetical protein M0R45_029439 [Rubus argutus]|uniref:Uncharacterized protein n=1 Tax=Rubus argutus TaxID=59490 RepID=A0AAW1WAJ6_RUBAR
MMLHDQSQAALVVGHTAKEVLDQFAPHAAFIVHELNGQDSTSTTCSIIPNADYSWRVVRILPNPSDVEDFQVEIFSSETREWIELVVLCQGLKNSYNSFHTYDCVTTNSRRPVAYNQWRN